MKNLYNSGQYVNVESPHLQKYQKSSAESSSSSEKEMKFRNEEIKYIQFGRSQSRGTKFGKGYLEAIKQTELILPKFNREEWRCSVLFIFPKLQIR